MDELTSIYEFANQHERIYIYGAGRYGRLCLELLLRHGHKVTGYIVSNKNDKEKSGIPIYNFHEILSELDSSDGIIIALNGEHQYQVLQTFPEKFLPAILTVSEKTWFYLNKCEFLDIIRPLNQKYPPAKDIEPTNWKRILIVRLDCIGDMVWTTAFIRELRRNFPAAKITLVLRPSILPLMKNCPYIDELLAYQCEDLVAWPSSEIESKAKAFADKYLVSEHYDVVFLPAFIDGIKVDNVFIAIYSMARVRVGSVHIVDSEKDKQYADDVATFFSILARHDIHKHHVECILEMLRLIGCKIQNTAMELWTAKEEKEEAVKLLKKNNTAQTLYVAVGLVASKPERTWDKFKYRQLISEIVQEAKRQFGNVCFVFCGGAEAREAARAAIEGNEPNCLDLTGNTTLVQALAIIEQCDCYIGSNTGLMHIACAFNLSVVAICCWKEGLIDSGIWGSKGVTVYPPNTGKLGDKDTFSTDAIDVNSVRQAFMEVVRL